jgi:hypothetical protein
MKTHFFLFIILFLFLSTLISFKTYVNKPTPEEFSRWLQHDYDTYDIACIDTACERIKLVTKETENSINMSLSEVEGSTGLFGYYTDRVYLSIDRKSFLHIRVEGFMGAFTILKEELN